MHIALQMVLMGLYFIIVLKYFPVASILAVALSLIMFTNVSTLLGIQDLTQFTNINYDFTLDNLLIDGYLLLGATVVLQTIFAFMKFVMKDMFR